MLKLTSKDDLYPTQLSRLHNPPKQLYISSNNWANIIKMPMLAVVGSRRPSTYGRFVCEQLAKEAAKRGAVIVSGLALGTDSYAHKAALEAGGNTIAVLPAGFNNIYPASHKNLADQIVKQGGALLSEYEPEAKIAYKGNFIARNRLIAGLSQAVLIPEAAENSGSLHTAKFALDIGVEVMAVPGLITNPLAAGSNNLLKTGATMITSISDVLNIMGIDQKVAKKAKIQATNPEEYIILSLINNGLQSGDEILEKSGLGVEQFNQTLSMLEITGQISPLGSNSWTLTLTLT